MNIDITGQNPADWFLYEGKEIMMTELLNGTELLLSEDIESVTCLTVTMEALGKPYTIDIILDYDMIEGVLKKIMDWCIDTERYEECIRVKRLQDMMNGKTDNN